MCVIAIADKTRPTQDMVEKMFDKNKEGAGIAWRDKGQVRWAKGLNLEQISSMIAKLPLPFIAHFRIETTGGVRPELTHPFPVDAEASLSLHGLTKGGVMFHNGTFHVWKERLMEAAVRSGTKLPGGRWNDSRALAFLASVYGIGVLDLIDDINRTVVMTPTDITLFGGTSHGDTRWARVNDVAVSNRLWEDVKFPTRVSGTESTTSTKPETETKVIEVLAGKPVGGASPEATFRNNAATVQRQEDKSESSKASPEEVRVGHGGHKERTQTETTNGKSPFEATLDTVQHTIRDEKDALDAIEWVRSKNPSDFRRSLRPEDEAERERRASNARIGITHMGRL